MTEYIVHSGKDVSSLIIGEDGGVTPVPLVVTPRPDHLPERQIILDYYNAELKTTHSQMCSFLYEKCCQPTFDDFVRALDNLLRACEKRVLDDAREAVMQALGPMDCEDPDQYLTALAAIDALRGEPNG